MSETLYRCGQCATHRYHAVEDRGPTLEHQCLTCGHKTFVRDSRAADIEALEIRVLRLEHLLGVRH